MTLNITRPVLRLSVGGTGTATSTKTNRTERKHRFGPIVDMLDVVVIGAGMAGITAARELVRSHYSVVVLEARDRIGGRVMTLDYFCNGPVEAGAEFIHGRKATTMK